jgi:hypothetical protein
LAWAVQAYGIPEDDRFGLLAALGADVASCSSSIVMSRDEVIALIEKEARGAGSGPNI